MIGVFCKVGRKVCYSSPFSFDYSYQDKLIHNYINNGASLLLIGLSRNDVKVINRYQRIESIGFPATLRR